MEFQPRPVSQESLGSSTKLFQVYSLSFDGPRPVLDSEYCVWGGTELSLVSPQWFCMVPAILLHLDMSRSSVLGFSETQHCEVLLLSKLQNLATLNVTQHWH